MLFAIVFSKFVKGCYSVFYLFGDKVMILGRVFCFGFVHVFNGQLIDVVFKKNNGHCP